MQNRTILLLKSLALNLPILRRWGYIFPRVVTLVVEHGMSAHIQAALTNFSYNTVHAKAVKNSDFDFDYNYVKGTKCDIRENAKVHLLQDAQGNGGLPVLLTENPVIEDAERNCFFIFLEERTFTSNFKSDEIVPHSKDLECIHKKMFEMVDSEMSEEEKILCGAALFLEPFCHRSEDFRLDELIELAHRLCVIDEEARDAHDVGDAFVKELFVWQENAAFENILDVNTVFDTEVDVKASIFFDDNFIYVHEALFKLIVAPLRKYVPINVIKKRLFESGVIDTGSCVPTTYTVKMKTDFCGGEYGRIRMMRFRRELLRQPAGLDFVDVCCMTREGDGCDERN